MPRFDPDRRPGPPALLLLILLVLPAAFLPACARAVPASPPSRTPVPSLPLPSPVAPTSGSGAGPSTPAPAPVVLVVLENHEYSSILRSPSAPYLNSAMIPRGRLFTDYRAVAHPSLPNYLAMTSGSTQGLQGTDAISAGQIAAENLFHQLSNAGVSWASFQESMPSPCFRGRVAGLFPDEYALKHDPAMAYRDIANSSLCRRVRPLSGLRTTALPSFSFISPNVCHDMHSCPVRTGDAWLAATVPALLRAGAIVIVTFDEGATDLGGGGRVMTLEVGPGVPHGVRDGRRFDHYGLLAGLELRYHVPLLGHARSAAPLPI